VEDYLRLQGRFAHLFTPQADPAIVADIQARVDSYWDKVV
jgi:pyruvate ferredoxin oxidoreductase beta subunit